MDNGMLRRRLLGAFVLLSLAVILWPMMFSNTTGPFVDKRTQIPQARTFKEYTVPQPTKPQGIAPVEERVFADEVAAPVPVEKATATKPQLNASGLPQSWVIQAGSFSESGNAKALELKLKQQGYKAYTETIATSKGTSVRVFVGPWLSKKQAVTEKQKIDRAFTLNGNIVLYVP